MHRKIFPLWFLLTEKLSIYLIRHLYLAPCGSAAHLSCQIQMSYVYRGSPVYLFVCRVSVLTFLVIVLHFITANQSPGAGR